MPLKKFWSIQYFKQIIQTGHKYWSDLWNEYVILLFSSLKTVRLCNQLVPFCIKITGCTFCIQIAECTYIRGLQHICLTWIASFQWIHSFQLSMKFTSGLFNSFNWYITFLTLMLLIINYFGLFWPMKWVINNKIKTYQLDSL